MVDIWDSNICGIIVCNNGQTWYIVMGKSNKNMNVLFIIIIIIIIIITQALW